MDMNQVRVPVAVLIAALALNGRADAQPLTGRPPNMEGTWVTSPWNLNFNFNHRFRIISDDDITGIIDDALLGNSPTFTLSLGLPSPFMVGVKYASEPSIVNPDRGNEWFPYIKVAPLRHPDWSVSITSGYNSQAESLDGELAGQASLGRLEFIGAVRGFSDALHMGEAGLALAGGAVFRLTNYLALAADVASFVAGPDTTAAWSAGIQMGIPYTPHTFSLQVSNSTSTILQEASFAGAELGPSELVWGFEFTVPFSGFARWSQIFDAEAAGESAGGAGAGAGAEEPGEPTRVVEIDVREFHFGPDTVRVPVGGAVRWVNRDPVAHTSTATGAEWESPLIAPGETYTTRFQEAGTFSYYCTPHPFMRGVIVVEPR